MVRSRVVREGSGLTFCRGHLGSSVKDRMRNGETVNTEVRRLPFLSGYEA